MKRRTFLRFSGITLISDSIRAQQASAQAIAQVGVILQGGPYYSHIDGLREGLRHARLEEGKQYSLIIHDAKGETGAAAEAAANLERDGVVLLVTFATSVTLAARNATRRVPIIFVAGGDPVALGLVDSMARPGGRLTGVTNLGHDLTSKRLELLRELVPHLRRVATFYNPQSRSAASAMEAARQACQALRVTLIESAITSPSDLRERIDAFTQEHADAYFFVSDAMVLSLARLILDRMAKVRVPAMAYWSEEVAAGALAGYGFGLAESGRAAATYVARVLAGVRPSELPIEAISLPKLIINMKVAKALGLTIPAVTLARAHEVIE